MTKEQLQRIFNNAIATKAAYVGVSIETRGMEEPEYIINPYANIAQKLVYYNGAYNDDLVLKTYDGIRITGAAAGKTIAGVMNRLKTDKGEPVSQQAGEYGA